MANEGETKTAAANSPAISALVRGSFRNARMESRTPASQRQRPSAPRWMAPA